MRNNKLHTGKCVPMFFFAVFFLLMVSAVSAQTDSKAKLDQAEQYYKSAQFDKAIEILKVWLLVDQPTKRFRKEALRSLEGHIRQKDCMIRQKMQSIRF